MSRNFSVFFSRFLLTIGFRDAGGGGLWWGGVWWGGLWWGGVGSWVGADDNSHVALDKIPSLFLQIVHRHGILNQVTHFMSWKSKRHYFAGNMIQEDLVFKK